MLLVVLICTALVLLLAHILLNYNEAARKLRNLSGPKEVFLLGSALEMFVSPIELFTRMRQLAIDFNGIYKFRTPTVLAVNIYNPQDIETVLSNMKHNEKSILYGFLEPWLQEGLLVSKGSKWQQRRKILTPAFHFNILKQFYDIFGENSRRFVDVLENSAGEPVDIAPVVGEFTLNSICETAMGTRLDEETTSGAGNLYKEAIYKLGYILFQRISRIYYFSNFIFNLSPHGKEQNKSLNIVHAFTKKVINDRKEFLKKNKKIVINNFEKESDGIFMSSKNKRVAFLDLLIAAENDGLIDNKGITEEVDTFMFEGHDTTSSGITFCLMSLAQNKDIQDKIVAELLDVLGNPMRNPTIDDLSKLRYLECCIKESLRLYPPVPFVGRKLGEPVTLSGHAIPAGVYCHIHIIDLHRREDLYKDALVFNPDRFLPENSVGRHPYAYIPFSAGPRNCIGQKFAILEMKTVIMAVLSRYELHPVTLPSALQFPADLVLRSSTPIYVKFVKRNYDNLQNYSNK